MRPRTRAIDGLLVLVMVLMLGPSGASASPPSRVELFVDRDGTAAIAAKYFPAAEIQRMHDRLTDQIKRRPELRNPYGEKFISLGKQGTGFYPFANALVGLQVLSCKTDGCETYKKFLEELGERTRIRAMFSSRGYSGCAHAMFDFVGGTRPTLTIKLFSRQFFHCRPTGRKLISSISVPIKRRLMR